MTCTQLNGLDEGAAFGDDVEMAINYPIVKLVSNSSTRKVYYARTFDWSSTGVATGINTPESVNFSTFGIPIDSYGYSVFVIANGISSAAPSPYSNFQVAAYVTAYD